MDTEKLERVDRGRRLKTLRAMTGKSQVEFAELCGVTAISITLWENAKFNGLSKKGARRVIQALETLGIHCSLPWLWQGLGNTPNFQQLHAAPSSYIEINKNFNFLESQLVAIKKESELFLSSVPDSLVLEITDDAMLEYKVGEYIGVIWTNDAATNLLDQTVLILLDENKSLVRKVGYDEEKNAFFLFASNSKSFARDLFVADANIQKIGVIVRVWRVMV